MLNGSSSVYPNTAGIMSEKMDSEFIYTFTSKGDGTDPTVLGEDSKPDSDGNSSAFQQKVLGEESKTGDTVNMITFFIIAGLVAFFTILKTNRRKLRKE